jgi:hypothetical protein
MDDKKLIQVALDVNLPWYVKEIKLNTQKNGYLTCFHQRKQVFRPGLQHFK